MLPKRSLKRKIKEERTKLLLIVGIFLAAFYVPWSHPIIRQSGLEAFMMLQEYAREHVLTCLIPAFFIAGAIAVFVSQASVLKYFGAKANKILSYSVASVSGTILAVCSCTVWVSCSRRGLPKMSAKVGWNPPGAS